MDSKVHYISGKSEGTVKLEELKYYNPQMPMYGLTRARGNRCHEVGTQSLKYAKEWSAGQ